MLCFFLWHVADHLLAHSMWDREGDRGGREREGGSAVILDQVAVRWCTAA